MGLLGPNGSGKTTLLRTIIDELPPLSGQVHIGHNVRIGYYSQTHADLNFHLRQHQNIGTGHFMGMAF